MSAKIFLCSTKRDYRDERERKKKKKIMQFDILKGELQIEVIELLSLFLIVLSSNRKMAPVVVKRARFLIILIIILAIILQDKF